MFYEWLLSLSRAAYLSCTALFLREAISSCFAMYSDLALSGS